MKRFLAETFVLFALLAAPWFVLGAKLSGLLSAGIAAAWLIRSLVAGYRNRPRDDGNQRWWLPRTGPYLGSGGLLALAVVVSAVLGWIAIVYDMGDNYLFDSLLSRALAPVVAVGLAVTVASYIGGLAFLRWNGVVSGNLAALARADMAGLFSSPIWLSYTLCFGLIGLVSTIGGFVSAYGLVDQFIPDRDATLLDVSTIFPFMPVGLLAATVLLTLARPLIAGVPSQTEAIRARFGPTGTDSVRPPAWRSLLAIGASVLILAAIIHPLHFGMVSALTVMKGIAPWQATSQAVVDWVAEQQDAGRGDAEITAELTAFGRWSPQAPDEGLAALLPALSNSLDTECSVSLAAATADPNAVSGISRVPGAEAGLGIKFCLRFACPSPVFWQAPAPLILQSSHSSHRRYWVKSLYLDVFAAGRAAEPGGYCTADGELAADFQG